MLACVLLTWCFYDGHHWILTGAIGDVLAIAICLMVFMVDKPANDVLL